MHPKLGVPNKSTTWLPMVCAEAVERAAEVRDAKDVPVQNKLAIEADDGCTPAPYRDARLVTYTHIQIQIRECTK